MIKNSENREPTIYMIQEQSSQQQTQLPNTELYEQMQFINTSDQPVCITGLESFNMAHSNQSRPTIILQQMNPQQQQLQRNHLNQKIILITSPNTTVMSKADLIYNVNQLKNQRQYQTVTVPTSATRVISVPFLPKLPTTTPIVKQSCSPIKIVSVKTAHQETHSSTNRNYMKETPTTANILIGTDLPKTFTPAYNQYTQTVSKIKPMRTLASMAGIQLTDSVESLPAAMSGAMPTTANATVEEINVPVFIDEYHPSITTTTNYDNINSNPEGLAVTSGNSEGNNDFCIEGSIIDDITEGSNILENFEFDIELIPTTDDNTASNSSATTTTRANSSHQQKEQEQQQQQQDEMYSINNESLDFLDSFLDDMTNVKQEMKYEELQDQYSNLPAQYHIIPPVNSEDIFSADDTIDGDISILELTENAVDFTNNKFELSQILISSQNNPMLSANCSSAPNSQIFEAEDLNKAEPIVPELNNDVINAESNLLEVIKMEAVNVVENDICDVNFEYKCSESGAIKRKNVQNYNNNNTMHEKRRKLHLDTSAYCAPIENTLNTPGVIDLIDKMDTDKHYSMNFNKNTEQIITDLLSFSNSSFQSAKTEAHTPFTVTSYDDNDDSPSTPQSCISSNYTFNTHTITSPNSPALSTISNTTRGNSTTKSKRGRPPKTHSDFPDYSRLLHLSESERKRLEDRAKNNEASRLSRLKNKQRDELEIEEERNLTEKNITLNTEHSILLKQEAKLKRALHRFMQNQRQ